VAKIIMGCAMAFAVFFVPFISANCFVWVIYLFGPFRATRSLRYGLQSPQIMRACSNKWHVGQPFGIRSTYLSMTGLIEARNR
jgi:hypothetical protein